MFKKVLVGLVVLVVVIGKVTVLQAKDNADVKKVTNIEKTEQKGTSTQESFAIEPELVMEYKPLKGEEVVDTIFDIATMTVKEARELGVKGLEQKKTMEEVEVKYPKVVITGEKVTRKVTEGDVYEVVYPKSLKFFDKKGNLKKKILIEEITPKGWYTFTDYIKFSKNRKYIGILSNRPRYKEEKPSEAKFTMINAEGEILWKIDINPVGWGAIWISPDGKYIICTGDTTGDYFGYMPSLWNANGLVKELVKKDLEETYKFGGGELLVNDCDFGKDASFFAITMSKTVYKNKVREKKVYLIIFDNKGNELWRKEVMHGHLVSISPENKIYFFTGKRDEFKVYIFDKDSGLFETKKTTKMGYAKLLYIKKKVRYDIEDEFYEDLKKKVKFYGIEDIDEEFYEGLQKK